MLQFHDTAFGTWLGFLNQLLMFKMRNLRDVRILRHEKERIKLFLLLFSKTGKCNYF